MARRNRQSEYERQRSKWQRNNEAAYLARVRREALEANSTKLGESRSSLADLDGRLKHMKGYSITCTIP